jgi:hypothetical protein
VFGKKDQKECGCDTADISISAGKTCLNIFLVFLISKTFAFSRLNTM